MWLTLQQLLDLPVIAGARPQVLTGWGRLDTNVRWVHTSEIYDIATLLKGEEVLLTTGLGLVAASPAQLQAYVDQLADRSVTALMMEVGRTFPAVPDVIVSRAQEHNLPVIALHGVVPFVEVTEIAHRLLIDQEVTDLRWAEQVTQQLTQVLLDGGGLRPLLQRISELVGSPARLVAADGRVVAHQGGQVASGETLTWPVTVFGATWGHLEVEAGPARRDPGSRRPGRTPQGGDRRVLLRQAATALALELVRGSGRSSVAAARRQLLLDLVEDRFASSAELSSRAAGVGMSIGQSEHFLAVCAGIEGPITTGKINAATAAAREIFGWPFVAESGNDLLIVGRASVTADSALRDLLGELEAVLDQQLRAITGEGLLTVAAGPLVGDAPALVGAFTTARELCTLARRLGGRRSVLLPIDLGVQRLLARLVGDAELELFVEEQLGPLLEHDARRGQDLVSTLDSYFEHGMSKARTAEALGVRRQTIYARIARIQDSLGDLTQRDRRTSLELALVAWRLRNSASNRT